MENSEIVLFRGRAEYEERAQRMFVIPDGVGASSHPFEISGAHTTGARTAVELAAESVTIPALVQRVARDAGLDDSVASALVSALVEHGVLVRVVPAEERVSVFGDGAMAHALRASVRAALLPARIEAVTIAILGTLGSAPWRENLLRAREIPGVVLTCSLDLESAWIGPRIAVGKRPCPACLAARRLAAEPSLAGRAPSVSHRPTFLASLCAHLLEWIERLDVGDGVDSEVLHVSNDGVRRRALLAQPGCRYCASSDSALEDVFARKSGIEARFQEELAVLDRAEPTEAQRAAFLDDALGPIVIEEHPAPGLIRELPLVLGSLRFMQPVAGGLERRELSSVTFGSGMTEHRRRLVAFAEGVERYAGICEVPDVVGKTFDELREYAFPPEETVRFLPEQYSGGADAPRRYEGQAVDWSWVYDWTSAGARLLIHDAVAFSHLRGAGIFRLFDDPFSSGTAAHRSMSHALERALLELIERDAFLLAWYLRLPLRELGFLDGHEPETDEMKGYLAARAVDVRFYDLRADFDVPCVLAAARTSRDCGPWRRGGVILSASAGTSWADAARHAVQEILGHYSVFGVVSPEGDKGVDPVTGNVRPWWQMFARYLEPGADEALSFLGGRELETFGAEARDTPPLELRLSALREQFLARRLPVLVRKLGGQDLEASGLKAVRVCVPGLLRLTPSRDTVNFGEPRLDQVRAHWSASPGINPLPHPLA